jgi:hypothetical protein
VTVDTAIRARLLSLAPIVALVNARVFTLVLPQGVTLPAIRVQRISQVEPMHFRGPVNVYQARVQVDSVGVTKASVDALDAAVQGDGLGHYASGLKGFKGSIGSPAFVIRAILPADVRDLYDAEELRQFKISRDFFVHFEGTQ